MLTIQQVYDCLSEGLLPNEASNFQSAEVLLGLAPTLLSTLAPSLGEISLVSTRRRFLALLLAVANPSIYVSRLLVYNDPREYLKHSHSTTSFTDALLNLTGRAAAAVSLLQYVLAAGAVVNVVQLSWRLGSRTVIAWKCNTSYLPFVWTIMPLAVHLVAAVGWHMSTPVRRIYHGSCTANHTAESPNPRSRFQQLCAQEFYLPSQFEHLDFFTPTANTQHLVVGWDKLAIFLNELAGFGSFLHLLFGTTVFSSLMFIGVLDAFQVIARYVASGLVCRIIVNWELAAMRAAEPQKAQQTRETPLPDDGTLELPERQTFPMM